MNALKGVLPELTNIKYNLNENFMIRYFDNRKRLIVIAKIDKEDTDQLFETIKKQRYVNRADAYQRL